MIGLNTFFVFEFLQSLGLSPKQTFFFQKDIWTRPDWKWIKRKRELRANPKEVTLDGKKNTRITGTAGTDEQLEQPFLE